LLDLSFEETSETLGALTVCYSSMIDRDRKAIGTRISLIGRPGIERTPIGTLLNDLNELLPSASQTLLIAPFAIAYDASLLEWVAPKNVILEVPAVTLHNVEVQSIVMSMHGKGVRLALRGRAAMDLPPDFLHLFEYSIINDNEDRRKGKPVDPSMVSVRKVKFAVAEITNVADADAAFMRGAAASIGWPIGETIVQDASQLSPSQAMVVRLISLVNQEADVKELDKILKLDPALSFKLLRFINSPAFGLSKRIDSFQQAVMMLGYTKLMRWLSLLLSSSSKDVNTFPLMYASIRRGLFLEVVAEFLGESRDSLFITGAFSLLDKITYTSFEKLFSMVSVADDIVESITIADGK
jgi:c-di-GMP phosphodiesterase